MLGLLVRCSAECENSAITIQLNAIAGILMAFWFSKKSAVPQLTEYLLPGGIGNVSLPDTLDVDLEDETTLRALPKCNSIELRFSSISFGKKGGDLNCAKSYVQQSATEQGHRYTERGEYGIEYFETESEDEEGELEPRFWHIGAKNTLVIVSATIAKGSSRLPVVRDLLSQMPKILETLVISKTYQIIEVDGTEIETTHEVVDPTNQKKRPFGSVEHAWAEANRQAARELSLKYGTGGELDHQELDLIFARWLAETDEKESDEIIANALGVAFGDHIVATLGFHWLIVSDENGTEPAVGHSIMETMAFPRASVQKRIEDRMIDFFTNIYLMIVDHLRQAENGE